MNTGYKKQTPLAAQKHIQAAAAIIRSKQKQQAKSARDNVITPFMDRVHVRLRTEQVSLRQEQVRLRRTRDVAGKCKAVKIR